MTKAIILVAVVGLTLAVALLGATALPGYAINISVGDSLKIQISH